MKYDPEKNSIKLTKEETESYFDIGSERRREILNRLSLFVRGKSTERHLPVETYSFTGELISRSFYSKYIQ